MCARHCVFIWFCFVVSGVLCMDMALKGYDCSENPVPNVTLLNPKGIQIEFEGLHWITSYQVVININEPFKYDPFNYFQIGQLQETLKKSRTVRRRSSSTTHWIYKNVHLQLNDGDEICYYLKVTLRDGKRFTKLYHYVRLENDTDLNKLVIAEDEVYLFNIKEFLIFNNFTFQWLENYQLRRARSNEIAQHTELPSIGRVIGLFDQKRYEYEAQLHPKKAEQYIE